MTPPHPSHWLVASEKSTQEDIVWNSDDHPPPGQSFDFRLSNNVFDQGCPISGVCVDWGTIPIKGYTPPQSRHVPPIQNFLVPSSTYTFVPPPWQQLFRALYAQYPIICIIFLYIGSDFTGLVSNILHCVVDWSKCTYRGLFLFFL